MKGLLIFYINVGNLPSKKALTYVDEHKKICNVDGVIDAMKEQGFSCMWLPDRTGSTRVEFIALNF